MGCSKNLHPSVLAFQQRSTEVASVLYILLIPLVILLYPRAASSRMIVTINLYFQLSLSPELQAENIQLSTWHLHLDV